MSEASVGVYGIAVLFVLLALRSAFITARTLGNDYGVDLPSVHSLTDHCLRALGASISVAMELTILEIALSAFAEAAVGNFSVTWEYKLFEYVGHPEAERVVTPIPDGDPVPEDDQDDTDDEEEQEEDDEDEAGEPAFARS